MRYEINVKHNAFLHPSRDCVKSARSMIMITHPSFSRNTYF